LMKRTFSIVPTTSNDNRSLGGFFVPQNLGVSMAQQQAKKKEAFVTEVRAAYAFHIQPKTKTQNYLLQSIENNTMVVCIGPAGTGKTFCSGMKAAQLFMKGGYDKIVLTRPNIATGKSLGYFPGTVEEKMEPWLKPLLEVLKDGFGKGRFDCMVQKGQIEIQPLETIRGRSFEDSIVLIDESQNLSLEELKAITTRIGEGSKLVLLGDPKQSDLNKGNDLLRFVKMCEAHGIDCPIVQFTVDDIVRSDIVMQLVKMFVKEDI
jgi:phosphate starvation-inducible PhoH-like protein